LKIRCESGEAGKFGSAEEGKRASLKTEQREERGGNHGGTEGTEKDKSPLLSVLCVSVSNEERQRGSERIGVLLLMK